jgi:hypothetical protein
VVLCGDFNVVPTDFDIYNPASWKKDALLQPESRAAYARLLKQGWIDSIRFLHPDERIYTFWDYFRNHWQRNGGLRIDHLLLNKVVAPLLHEAGVDRWVRGEAHASDHAPAWIRLAPKKVAAKTQAGARKSPGSAATKTGSAAKKKTRSTARKRVGASKAKRVSKRSRASGTERKR